MAAEGSGADNPCRTCNAPVSPRNSSFFDRRQKDLRRLRIEMSGVETILFSKDTRTGHATISVHPLGRRSCGNGGSSSHVRLGVRIRQPEVNYRWYWRLLLGPLFQRSVVPV